MIEAHDLYSILNKITMVSVGLFTLLGFVGTHKLSLRDIEKNQALNIIVGYLEYFNKLSVMTSDVKKTIKLCKKIKTKENKGLIPDMSDREFKYFKEACRRLEKMEKKKELTLHRFLYFLGTMITMVALPLILLSLLTINPLLFKTCCSFFVLTMITMFSIYSLGVSFSFIKFLLSL